MKWIFIDYYPNFQTSRYKYTFTILTHISQDTFSLNIDSTIDTEIYFSTELAHVMIAVMSYAMFQVQVQVLLPIWMAVQTPLLITFIYIYTLLLFFCDLKQFVLN